MIAGASGRDANYDSAVCSRKEYPITVQFDRVVFRVGRRSKLSLGLTGLTSNAMPSVSVKAGLQFQFPDLLELQDLLFGGC
jgi:hypothetical protein